MRFDDGRVIPELLGNALAGRPLVLHGSGSQTRSFCYVSDLVRGLLFVGLDDGNDGEISGPLDFGFAMTRLSPRPGAREQRVVVIGDGDFLSNSYLGNGGNRDFGTRIFDWLLTDDALIEIPEAAAQDRAIKLSDAALAAVSFGFLLGLPILLAGSGLWIWRRRRRR
jgi:LPXTG-motif cell wall-anchored protein